MAEKILVMGATGLLGRAVAHFLKVAGFEVRVLSRKRRKRKIRPEEYP